MSIGEVSRYILANAVGILAGTCGVLILQTVVSTSGGFSAVVIFSSVISFFVLGTIFAMVYSSTKVVQNAGAYSKSPVVRILTFICGKCVWPVSYEAILVR